MEVTPFFQELGARHNIIMAPMFLVTNEAMMIAAYEAGTLGCLPAHNLRTVEEFETTLKSLHQKTKGHFGINLIVNKSNIHYPRQLEALMSCPPKFVITSLGSPEETIKKCHSKGIQVFCDVIDKDYSEKVIKLGADALIAVNSGAGGHAGRIPAHILIPSLTKSYSLPVINAGGVGDYQGMKSMMDLGAVGCSVGSPFIASHECGVSQAYKQACVDYGASDIVLTSKISGTPCTVIKTPYLEKIGVKENPLEALLNSNKKIKKYAKMIKWYFGMKALERAASGASYKTLWCAGPSIEYSHKIKTMAEIVDQLTIEGAQG